MEHGNPKTGLINTDLEFIDISLDPEAEISKEIRNRWKKKDEPEIH